MTELELRRANVGDVERLLEIYAPYVEKTAITFEDKVPPIGEFQNRILKTLQIYPYLVALKDGKIVGYAYASAFKERAAYDHSVELSIYVDANVCHQHVGRFLYDAIEDCLKKQGFLMLISQDFTTQTIRLTDFLPAVFLLCMTFQKREDLSFSSGTFINSF
ncbi:GNAT family N-acetyltransferase [Lactobacillus delbrueckii]|uniref:GNAT family N-acetyltransferase n=1 Tax=Lactobacillus delbrueckii TaxID=1584 RepID=UPI0035117C41